MPRWQVRLLGTLTVEQDGQAPVRFRTQATGAVFAYLVLHLGQEVSRDQIAADVWPRAEPEAASRNLRTALSSLRSTFGQSLGSTRQSVWLDPHAFDVDVRRFCETRDPTWYRGRLLAGQEGTWLTHHALELEEMFVGLVLELSTKLPTAEAIALLTRALSVDPSRLDLRARLRTLGPSYENLQLPTIETAFVGRKLDLDDLTGLLRDSRLITITGPGGCGKSRLAHQLVRERPDRAWFVPLAHVSDPSDVLSAIVASLRLSPALSSDPVECLGLALGGVSALLVLDNMEQLRANPSPVAQLLDAIPTVQLVTTSRVPLGLEGEVEYPLGPLALGEAEALFRDRCSRVCPGIDLSGADEAVRLLCERLDGYPLALEIAAAKSRMMTPVEMVDELSDRFEFLTRGAGASRHQSLQRALDVTFELLEPEPQRLLIDLATFVGTFTRASASSVLGPEADEGLQDLVASAWVLPRLDTEPRRFRLIESVRIYASELATPARQRLVQESHARHFAVRAQACAEHAFTPSESALHDQAELDLPNFEVAWAWLSKHDPDAALSLVNGLNWFTILRGHWSWADERISKALSLASDTPRYDLAFAHHSCGNFLLYQGRQAESEPWYNRALEIAREIGHSMQHGQSLLQRAQARAELGRYNEAHVDAITGLPLIENMGAPHWTGAAYVIATLVANRRGDVAEALRLGQVCVAFSREGGYPWGVASALNELAMAQHLAGDLTASLASQEESIEIKRSIFAPLSLALSYADRAATNLKRGQRGDCRLDLREAAQLLQVHHSPSVIPRLYVTASRYFGEAGDIDSAVRCRHVARQLTPSTARHHAHFEHFFDPSSNESGSYEIATALERIADL